jgi:hypothetical protein
MALVWVLPMVLRAGEGYREQGTNSTVRLDGYGGSISEMFNPRPLDLDINLKVWVKGGDPQWVQLASDSDEIRKLVRATIVAANLWEEIPTTRLEFRMGLYRRISSTFRKDNANVMTLAGGTYGYGGQGGGHLQITDGVYPEIVEFDTTLKRSTNRNNPTSAQSIMVQEVGHGVGFNHSLLTRDIVLGITGEGSLNSLMSSGGGLNLRW